MSDMVCKVCGNEIVKLRSLPNRYGHLHGSNGSHRAEPSEPDAAHIHKFDQLNRGGDICCICGEEPDDFMFKEPQQVSIEPKAAVSEGRNDYQSLYNEKPYAVVSEDKEEPLPNFVSEGLDEGLPHGTHRQAQPQPAGTEPLPEIKDRDGWYDERNRLQYRLEQRELQLASLQRRLTTVDQLLEDDALQQSHDACVEAAKDFADFVESEPDIFQIADPTCNLCTQGCTPISHDKGLCSFHRLRAALANAEKLRAAK